MSVIETLRHQARACFQAGLRAADPYDAVTASLRQQRDGVVLCGYEDEGCFNRVYSLAFGKAALRMSQAALLFVPPSCCAAAVVVTNEENRAAFKADADFDERIDLYRGGHPLPHAGSEQAARALLHHAHAAAANELVLVLISGGGSSLVCLASDGLTLQDKIDTTAVLLRHGVSIHEMNIVRKHLSQFKGGRLAQAACPARLHALILSDVVGDDLATIASGPTVVDTSTYQDALDVLAQHGLSDAIPPRVTRYLRDGARGQHAESMKADDAALAYTSECLIGSNRLSVQAAHKEACRLDFAAQVWRFDACGDVHALAQEFAKDVAQDKRQGKRAWLLGGETTVQVSGDGLGGRNQEFGVSFALAAESFGLSGVWAFLSGGSDGRDGPTDAAGACVDSTSLQRWRQKGDMPQDSLRKNDCYHLLKRHGDLLVTQATGTNVADLQILLLDDDADYRSSV